MRRPIAAMLGVAALAAAPLALGAGPVRNLDAILRALAPIDGQVEADAPPPSIDLAVGFAVNSAALEPSAIRQLDELGRALGTPALARFRFEIAGHTDATGPAAHNKALSLRRAASVKDYLVARHGVDPARLETAGWGSDRSRDTRNPGGASNRRVEIVTLGPVGAPPRPGRVQW